MAISRNPAGSTCDSERRTPLRMRLRAPRRRGRALVNAYVRTPVCFPRTRAEGKPNDTASDRNRSVPCGRTTHREEVRGFAGVHESLRSLGVLVSRAVAARKPTRLSVCRGPTEAAETRRWCALRSRRLAAAPRTRTWITATAIEPFFL